MVNKLHIINTLKHTLIYGSAGVLGKTIGFLMLPIYAHHLQTEGYGIIGMIDVLLSVLTVMIGYGASAAMTRLFYETNEPITRKRIVSTSLILMFLLVAIITTPVILFSNEASTIIFGRNDWGNYIIFGTISFIAEMTAKNSENYLQIKQKSFLLSCILTLKLIIGLILNIYLIVYLQLGVTGYLYSTCITGTIHCIVTHFLAFRDVGILFETRIAKELLKFSIPLIPGYLALFIRNNSDRIIIRMFQGISYVGIFEMLFKFSTLLIYFVSVPFFKIWNVKRLEISDEASGPATLSTVFTYHLLILLFFSLLLSLEIPIILKLLTPKDFWLSGYIVLFAVLARVLTSVYYHFCFGLIYAKKTGQISIIHISTSIVSISCTIPLTIRFGIHGAVISAFIAALHQCAFAYLKSQKYYKIPYKWKLILVMIALQLTFYCIFENISSFETVLDMYITNSIMYLIYIFEFSTSTTQVMESYIDINIYLFIDATIYLIASCIFLITMLSINRISAKKIYNELISYRKNRTDLIR